MKILIIYTGGTIGSLSENDIISPDKSSKRALLNSYNNKDNIIFSEAEPYYALSENNTGEELTRLIECTVDNLNNYDGIIIAHGTDTLQYSAAAVSFAVGLNTLPIVFVSANHPLNDERSNGADNFSGAVDFIKNGCGKGAFISYKNSDGMVYIHRASRAMAHFEYSDDLFSVKNQYYGIIKNSTFIKNEAYTEKTDELSPFGKVKLEKHSRIKAVSSMVGNDYDISKNAIYLIKAYHSGTLCTADDNLKSLAENCNSIFISGFDKQRVYESATVYNTLGLKILPPSSFISSYIKLWMADSLNLPLDDIMQKSLGGDLL